LKNEGAFFEKKRISSQKAFILKDFWLVVFQIP